VQRDESDAQADAAPIAPAEAIDSAPAQATKVDQLISQGFGAPPTTAPEGSTPQAVEPTAAQAPSDIEPTAPAEAPVTQSPVPAASAIPASSEVATTAPSPAAKADSAEPINEPAAEEIAAPWWIIPLEQVNRPFASIPESLRNALGKAAILTFINAAALLVYVLKFRK
jgi:hypothetical protein